MGYILETNYIIKKKIITVPETDFLLLNTTPYLLLSLQANEYCMLFGAACVFGNPGYYSGYQHLFIDDGNASTSNIARFDESIVNSKTTINFAINQKNNFLGYTPSIKSTTSLYLNSQSIPYVLINGSVDIVLYYDIL